MKKRGKKNDKKNSKKEFKKRFKKNETSDPHRAEAGSIATAGATENATCSVRT